MQVLLISDDKSWSRPYKQLARFTAVRGLLSAKQFCQHQRHPIDAIICDASEIPLQKRCLHTLLQTAPLMVWQRERSCTDELFYLQAGVQHYCSGDVPAELMAEYLRLVKRRVLIAEKGNTSSDNQWPWLGIYPERHVVMLGRHEIVGLTVTEFKLFDCLLSRPGQVKNRDQLMDVAYDEQVYVDDRTVDSHIRRLRKKLRKLTGHTDAGNIIETIYGIGYVGRPEKVECLFVEPTQVTAIYNH